MGKQEKYGGGGGWKSKEMWLRWWREIKRNVAVWGRGNRNLVVVGGGGGGKTIEMWWLYIASLFKKLC